MARYYTAEVRAELRAYYESHEINLKELAERSNIPYRTLAGWRKAEKWKPKIAIKDLEVEVINHQLTTHKVHSFLGSKKEEIKDVVRENLKHIEVDPIVMECILETSSDELLLKAMNLHFINKNILLAAIIAKDELLKMVRNNLDNAKGNPVIIAAAEKVAKMFSDLKISLYGKEVLLAQETLENDYSKMTTDELLKLANEGQK
ncbi:hypothetical protein ACFOPX_03430 [Helicobacter baculiformis]|uniref:Terminase n=1 Tax=Helicobacter baculiformis TaxID=427351 RepID=A0ABV7ZIG3_9HELI|nr:hypothetical protein [Helicobacter baculiformis]